MIADLLTTLAVIALLTYAARWVVDFHRLPTENES